MVTCLATAAAKDHYVLTMFIYLFIYLFITITYSHIVQAASENAQANVQSLQTPEMPAVTVVAEIIEQAERMVHR